MNYSRRELVLREVHCNASHLVSEILETRSNPTTNAFEEFDLENWLQYDEETDSDKEVFEWWIVSRWLAKKFEAMDEVLVKSGNLYFWGRQTTGQLIEMDWAINQVYENLKESGL